jgi:DNA primase
VALAQFGVGYAVATLGTATTQIHVAKLLRLTNEIVYCFDGDNAGRKAAWRALEITLPVAPDSKPIKFLFLPDGEDPDTYVRKHGKEKFERAVAEAETLTQFLLSDLRSRFNLDTNEGRAQFVAAAKPYVQKVTAPILRVQLINSVAELGRISEDAIRDLLQIPQSPRYKRAAPAKSYTVATNSLEWRLLYSVLVDLSMVVHIDQSLLRSSHPESGALLAIQEFFQSSDDPSVPILIERLEGSPSLEYILQASRFADDLRFSPEDAQMEMQGALAKLDEFRRKVELDGMLGSGLRSRQEQEAYNAKMMLYKRLQGALRPVGEATSAAP